MYICIGGDLNGEVVTGREGTYFEASEINTEKSLHTIVKLTLLVKKHIGFGFALS